MHSQIAKCFHQAPKLSGDSVAFWPKDLGLVLVNIVVIQIFWRIQKWGHLPQYEKVKVIYILIILVALVGLVQIENCHFRHVGLLHGEVTRLLFKVPIFFPQIRGVVFETSLFICSNRSLHPTVKDIFCH